MNYAIVYDGRLVISDPKSRGVLCRSLWTFITAVCSELPRTSKRCHILPAQSMVKVIAAEDHHRHVAAFDVWARCIRRRILNHHIILTQAKSEIHIKTVKEMHDLTRANHTPTVAIQVPLSSRTTLPSPGMNSTAAAGSPVYFTTEPPRVT